MEMNQQFLARDGVFPRGCPQGRSQLRAECLIEGHDPAVDVTVRLLQVVERQILDAKDEPVEFLTVAGKRYASRSETIERELRISTLPDRTAMVKAADSKQAELVEKGARAGTLLWHWESMHCTVEAWIEELDPGLSRVRVEVANRLEWDGGGRERTLLRTLHSAYVVIHTPDGAFVSLADPPHHLRARSANCRNEGLWPVPAGKVGDRRTMLATPTHLEDYPRGGLSNRNTHPSPL